jgi:hypothetical protein
VNCEYLDAVPCRSKVPARAALHDLDDAATERLWSTRTRSNPSGETTMDFFIPFPDAQGALVPTPGDRAAHAV